jgi:hypothetical protein
MTAITGYEKLEAKVKNLWAVGKYTQIASMLQQQILTVGLHSIFMAKEGGVFLYVKASPLTVADIEHNEQAIQWVVVLPTLEADPWLTTYHVYKRTPGGRLELVKYAFTLSDVVSTLREQ